MAAYNKTVARAECIQRSKLEVTGTVDTRYIAWCFIYIWIGYDGWPYKYVTKRTILPNNIKPAVVLASCKTKSVIVRSFHLTHLYIGKNYA